MQQGDFVTIEYVAKTRNGKIFDVTVEEIAKREGVYSEGAKFGPVTIVLGFGHVIPGLEKAIFEMEVGEEREVEIPPENAFGKRNRNLLVKIPLREFRKHNIFPRPGVRMPINDRIATVRSVSSGRVTLDFNHPLAGKTVFYWVRVLKKVEDLREKILAVFGILGINYDVEVDEKNVKIDLNVEKGREKLEKFLSQQLKKYIPEIERIEFC